MTYAKQIEAKKLQEWSRGFKKARVDGGGSNSQSYDYGSNGKCQGRKPFICKDFTNNHPPKFNKDKGPNHMFSRDNVGAQDFPPCKKCGRTQKGECFAGSNVCFKCGKPGHHAKNCRGGGGGVNRTQVQVDHDQQAYGGGKCTNHFYALHRR
ncbi:cold shock domain-containing protein 3-like [Solanum dulcamara]|uniref:cold shock domain-containing protein 3-like n=1 Tax=Solanum dulcamara TaxID=45834 RepID=UPI0024867DC6|nr:cold shock domain-containing protein 3-like [Solanum dulcamara]